MYLQVDKHKHVTERIMICIIFKCFIFKYFVNLTHPTINVESAHIHTKTVE